MDYSQFLDGKAIRAIPTGIPEPGPVPSMLFPFQADIVRWALKRGRAAIFADCGMGKTPMQLAWADQIPGKVLILAPLAVAQQTVREGKKFGIDLTYSRSTCDARITITNYEMLDHFNSADYTGIVLDESSILKSYDGKFRQQIIESFKETPFKLACTATPAPNDHMELGNHAEFLGVLTRTEMLSTFFVHDGGDTSKWRIKGHAETDFWKWITSWAVMIRKPSDLGYEDGDFILPELVMHPHIVQAQHTPEGHLFALEATTLQERQQARKLTTPERVAKVAEIVARNGKTPIIGSCGNQSINKTENAEWLRTPNTQRGSDPNGLEHLKKTQNTCVNTENPTHQSGSDQENSKTPSTPEGVSVTPKIPISLTNAVMLQDQDHLLLGESPVLENTESALTITEPCFIPRVTVAPSVETNLTIDGTSTLTTAMRPDESVGSCALNATSDSGSSKTMSNDLREQFLIWCNLNSEGDAIQAAIPGSVQVSGSDDREFKEQTVLDFVNGKIRVLISKPTIFGYGLNLQGCHNVIFLGLSDSYEQFYQAIRRCWRFGQTKPVHCHIVTSDLEGAVVSNIERKEADAARMAEGMVSHMHELNEMDIRGTVRTGDDYKTNHAKGTGWDFHLGDCVEVVGNIPSDSIGYSIFSPPFASLYTYSASARDMGNCRDAEAFYEHFRFLIRELYRVMMPGRNLSFHCMNLPFSKERDGFIGIRDFRGELIRMFQDEGFIFHSEVCIWKDPVTAMQRTKAIGLLHKQIKKDSTISRQGIPDYLVTMRKPGVNPEPVTHTNETFPVQIWQKYASPVWMDINPSDTLQRESAREEKDERHICPLQLQVIQRGLDLWSNPGDLVLSPFGGIGSEGFMAVKMGRRFVGAELKESYWRQGCRNLKAAEETEGGLFDHHEACPSLDTTQE